jgi:hypothetical protein
MTTARAARPAVNLDQAIDRFVLVDAGAATGWTLLPRRRGEAWLARLRHRSLDARLRAGEPAESSRLLAVRTALLVTPASRHRIARRWDALAATARACLPRAHLDVAEYAQAVADVLRGDQPVSVRGVAVAGAMLRVAADGLQRPGAGGADLAAAAARAAIAAM